MLKQGSLLLVTVLTVAGCGIAAPMRPAWDDVGFITVDGTPVEAHVYLDGRRVGVISDVVARPIYLPAGRHSIDVVAPGYHPYSTRFDVHESVPAYFKVVLREQRVPAGTPK
jgi:hypothetical protein